MQQGLGASNPSKSILGIKNIQSESYSQLRVTGQSPQSFVMGCSQYSFTFTSSDYQRGKIRNGSDFWDHMKLLNSDHQESPRQLQSQS